MTPLDRLESSMRSAWLPLALLLVALSTVFIFGGDRGYFYRPTDGHNWISSEHLAIAVNISPEHGFQRFKRRFMDEDGAAHYVPYNRFPIGGYVGMKLSTLPFGGSASAQLTAARVLILLFFTAGAVLVYVSLCRLVSNRWIALAATLLSFSSYYLLYYNDMTANEGMPDLFGVMLTFHGMVIFVQEGRFRQLLVKACIALLLGWHVFALLLPFVIFGLASEVIRTRSAAASSPASPLLLQGKRAAGTLIRSRYLLLGIVALGFGLSILTFNFAMEYVALNGETPLTELPSFTSAVGRIGIDQGTWPWMPFLEEQFFRISRLFVPFFLLGSENVDQSTSWLSKPWSAVLGIALSLVGLIGSIFLRHRILFASLASFGFIWAVPMRITTAPHKFESIYYIGLPLVFFTIILLLARRLTNRDVVVAAAAFAAVALFAVSSFQMSRIGYSAESAQMARSAEQDLRTIRELVAKQRVTVLKLGGDYRDFFNRANHAMNYYLNSSFIDYFHLPAVEGGFVVMRERVDTDALLTPQNEYFFLYDRDGLEQSYGAMYRSVASGEPLASGEFDMYLNGRTVYYLKEPCEREQGTGRFFLNVYPIDTDDLPVSRRPEGFSNVVFPFLDRGLTFNGKCLASVELPQYDVAKINAGRFGSDAWSAPVVVAGPRLNSIVSTEPVARAEFDLYLDGGKLYYVKEPCGDDDTAARFFLHVIPENIDDLPDKRKQYEFDNLDFDFSQRGVLFDGKCLVGAYLPRYDTVSVSTGQFDKEGRIWGAEFIPDAHE